jgi:hypothetical protein
MAKYKLLIMKKTRNLLMAFFCLYLLTAGVLYVFGEFVQADLAFFSNIGPGTRMYLPTVMILMTLCAIPFALWMFRKRRIHDDLVNNKVLALMKWGTLRLMILGNLLVINTFFYYAFGFEASYGYLAIVVLLSMAFVFPSMNRCMAETTETTEEKQPSDADNTDDAEDSQMSEPAEAGGTDA